MPFLVASVLRANDTFGRLGSFNPAQIKARISEAGNMTQVAEELELFEGLAPEHVQDLKSFLATVPKSLDAALLAGVRSALERGLRSQITWQPGYEFELRGVEVSDEAVGLVNFLLVTPHPPETQLA